MNFRALERMFSGQRWGNLKQTYPWTLVTKQKLVLHLIKEWEKNITRPKKQMSWYELTWTTVRGCFWLDICCGLYTMRWAIGCTHIWQLFSSFCWCPFVFKLMLVALCSAQTWWEVVSFGNWLGHMSGWTGSVS